MALNLTNLLMPSALAISCADDACETYTGFPDHERDHRDPILAFVVARGTDLGNSIIQALSAGGAAGTHRRTSTFPGLHSRFNATVRLGCLVPQTLPPWPQT